MEPRSLCLKVNTLLTQPSFELCAPVLKYTVMPQLQIILFCVSSVRLFSETISLYFNIMCCEEMLILQKQSQLPVCALSYIQLPEETK